MNVIMTITRALECNLVLQKHDGDSCEHDFIRLWWFLFSIYKHISICRIKYSYILQWLIAVGLAINSKLLSQKLHFCFIIVVVSGMMFFSCYRSFFWHYFFVNFFSSNLVSLLLHVNSLNFSRNWNFEILWFLLKVWLIIETKHSWSTKWHNSKKYWNTCLVGKTSKYP